MGIKGNKPNISFGGQLVRDLLEQEEYILLNNLDMIEGVHGHGSVGRTQGQRAAWIWQLSEETFCHLRPRL